MKKPLLFIIFTITIIVVFLLASLNVASVPIETAFGTKQISVFLVVLFSFLIGAFCMFILQIMGSKEEAITGVSDIKEESPHYKKAVTQFNHGNYEKALKELNKIQFMHSKIEPLILKTKCLISLKQWQEAKSLAEFTKSNFPANIELLYLTSDIYIKCNLKDKAKEALRTIITLDFKDAFKAYLVLQNLLIEEGNYADALKIYEDINYHFPEKIDAELKNQYYGLCYKLASKYIQDGNYKEALYYSKELIDKSESFSLAYYIQAKIYSSVKEENQLLKVAAKGILATKNYILLKVVEDFYLSEFNPAAAIEFYKNMIYESKNNKVLIFALGLFYQRLEMVEEANSIYEKLHNQYPHWQELALLKAQLYLKMQKKEAAAEMLERYMVGLSNIPVLFRCSQCGSRSSSYVDKCEECGWWGMINLSVPRDEETAVEPVMWAESIF